MKYQKRHYEDMAALIRLRARSYSATSPEFAIVRVMAMDMAVLFAADNPRFRSDQFLKAAYVAVE